MNKNRKIGFIGAGTMAKAIINGIIASRILPKENITASEISPEQANKASEETGIKIFTDNIELAKDSDVIILCVKPYAVEDVLKKLKSFITEDKMIVSIAAGVSVKTIEEALDKKIPVIRVMPNTPVLVREGMSAVCKGQYASKENADFVINIFNSIGRCIEVEEKFINAVTGISGSGPAFMYLIIDAIADGGVKMGLKKEIAIELAAQTAVGAAKMILETGKHPAILKDEVTTPGGCTIAGLSVMENEHIRSALIKTVQETALTAAKLG
ncbi:MAG TPA: pyrroline-5-carboxylate reductase [Candidatus Gastranaerophilales bacterium]|nr:pyrroline-5-carboxylate reductase [Candidatus Gastranaerophilales bacterium]